MVCPGRKGKGKSLSCKAPRGENDIVIRGDILDCRMEVGMLRGKRMQSKTGYSTRAVTRDDAGAYLFKLDSKATSLGEVSKAIKHPWVL